MNRLVRVQIVACLLLIMLGCARSKSTVHIPLKSEISKSKLIYVMQAKDGSYGKTIYKESGLYVSKKILRALRKMQPLAQLIEETNEVDAVNLAKKNGASYLIVPEIIRWEDRATAWSGFRDKVEIELRLLSLDPLEVIASQSYYATNNSITIFNTKPENLLGKRFDNFIYQLLSKEYVLDYSE